MQGPEEKCNDLLALRAGAPPGPSVSTCIHALVLRGTDVGETSRLVTLFTAEHARLTVRARGLRQRRSRHAAVLEPFNIIEARILHRERAEIHFFQEGTVLQDSAAISGDVTRAAAAAVWFEMLDRVDCSPDEAPVIFAWAQAALAALSTCADPRSLGLLGGWQLLDLLGHRPVLDRCLDSEQPPRAPLRFSLDRGGLVSRSDPTDETEMPITAGLVKILARVPGTPADRLTRLRLSALQARALLDLFHRFCQCHLETRLRSVRFLQSLETP